MSWASEQSAHLPPRLASSKATGKQQGDRLPTSMAPTAGFPVRGPAAARAVALAALAAAAAPGAAALEPFAPGLSDTITGLFDELDFTFLRPLFAALDMNLTL